MTCNSNLLQKNYMQVASMGLSLDAYEDVVQDDKYNLQFVTTLGGECFAFCWDKVLISPHVCPSCTPGIYIKVSGSPKEAHDWLQPTQWGDPTSSSSTSVCAPSILVSGSPTAQLALGGSPTTLLYTGVCTTQVVGCL